MKFNPGAIEWDRFDEDRWIAASITSIIVVLLAFLVLKSIRIPENPKKVTITEEIDFVKPEVKKKVIKPKKVQEKIPEEKVIEEDPEIIVSLLMDAPKNIPNLPQQNLQISNEFKIFEQENPTMEQAQAIQQISDGLLLQESEFDPIEVNKGLPLDQGGDITSTVITPNIGDHSLKDNMGISRTIQTKEHRLSNDFSGFKGKIEWENMLDPIFKWIRDNATPIGPVPMLKLANNDKTALTAKVRISVDNVSYLLYLVSRESKHQLTICLVNLAKNDFVVLVDPGLTKKSSVFNTGKASLENDEVIHFSRSIYKNANDPKAKEFMKIFWQWARSVTGRG